MDRQARRGGGAGRVQRKAAIVAARAIDRHVEERKVRQRQDEAKADNEDLHKNHRRRRPEAEPIEDADEAEILSANRSNIAASATGMAASARRAAPELSATAALLGGWLLLTL